MAEPVPLAAPAPRRPLLGVFAAGVVLAVVAVPAALCAYAALLFFIGGGLYADSDAPPDVAVGVLWSACALVLLALPVLAGLVTARVSIRREHRARNVWVASGAVVIVVAALAYLGRVV